MGNSIGCITSVFVATEKISMWSSGVVIISSIIFTMTIMLGVGIGVGYNYCYVDVMIRQKYNINLSDDSRIPKNALLGFNPSYQTTLTPYVTPPRREKTSTRKRVRFSRKSTMGLTIKPSAMYPLPEHRRKRDINRNEEYEIINTQFYNNFKPDNLLGSYLNTIEIHSKTENSESNLNIGISARNVFKPIIGAHLIIMLSHLRTNMQNYTMQISAYKNYSLSIFTN